MDKFVEDGSSIHIVDETPSYYGQATAAVSTAKTISQLEHAWPFRHSLDDEEKQNFGETFVKKWLFIGGNSVRLEAFLDRSNKGE